MGGQDFAIDEREAASALRWWLESGVDSAIQETSRNWFERDSTPSPPVAEPGPSALPDTLEAFRSWLSGPDAPLAAGGSRPVLPIGADQPETMVLCEPPGRDELASAAPVGGAAAELMERMLAAIGMTGRAYVAGLACFHSPAARLSPAELERCAEAARRHVALVAPNRLLLLGDAPCQALLGKPLVEARGHVHKVEGIRAVATFHPRQLLKRPSDKALAWKDLLLLTEDLQ